MIKLYFKINSFKKNCQICIPKSQRFPPHKMEKKNLEYLTQIPLDELEEYGFVFIRDQPCRIQKIDYMRPQKKFKKRETLEDAPEKIRASVIAHNVFTDQEVFNGVIAEDPVTVPKIQWEDYEVVNLEFNTGNCRLMLEGTEDFEEFDHIKQPVERPVLLKEIRNAFTAAQDLGDRLVVQVLEIWGRTEMYEYKIMIEEA
jgi:hypothetical protein